MNPETKGESATAPALSAELLELIDDYLNSLEFARQRPMAGLSEAMRYALLAEGKRVRPLLALGTAKAIELDPASVLPFAAAVEMIHTYSLIHDDLPAMDDDDFRRGNPTCHKKFGEAVAILAGDGLYAEAFSLVLQRQQGEPQDVLAAARELAQATGTDGMVGGQYMDVTSQLDLSEGDTGSFGDDDADLGQHLQSLHQLKTGRLIRASVECVLILAGDRGRDKLPAFRRFTDEIGLLFQIVDDILDVTANSATLGKPSRSDIRNAKQTYVSHYGLDRARQLAGESHQRAVVALEQAGGTAAGNDDLRQLTDFFYLRSS